MAVAPIEKCWVKRATGQRPWRAGMPGRVYSAHKWRTETRR